MENAENTHGKPREQQGKAIGKPKEHQRTTIGKHRKTGYKAKPKAEPTMFFLVVDPPRILFVDRDRTIPAKQYLILSL